MALENRLVFSGGTHHEHLVYGEDTPARIASGRIRNPYCAELSDRFASLFAGSDANYVRQVKNEYLAVAHVAGVRAAHYGIYRRLDELQTVMDNVFPNIENGRKAPAAVRDKVREDHAGAKVGHGFYKYAERTFEEIMTERDAKVAHIVKSLRPKVGAR